jgi:spore maturation protein CgeB
MLQLIFSGKYKVNMRNFESLGCGAHLISDEGIYPEGLIADKDFSIYTSMDDFKMKARYFLDNINESRDIAKRGHKTVTEKFSKDIQWDRFKEIVSDL